MTMCLRLRPLREPVAAAGGRNIGLLVLLFLVGCHFLGCGLLSLQLVEDLEVQNP